MRQAGIAVVQLNRRGHMDWRRLAELARVFRAIRPHVVYSFHFDANAYARLAGLLAGVPILVSGERTVYLSRSMGILERVLMRFTECVICNAEAIRRDLVDRIKLPEHKVITVLNAVVIPGQSGPLERRAARQLIGAGEDEIVVGTIGALAERKNLAVLVRAASYCTEAMRLRFVIVGGGPDEQALRASIQEHGMEDRFKLLGEREEAWKLLPGFDMFVLTSRSEGMPNALMEAMAAGRPCVCTDVGGCRELLEHGKTGYLVTPGGAREVADRIVELSRDPALRASMGRAGRERIAVGYSVERLVSDVEGILLRLLDAAASSPRGHRLQPDVIDA